MSELADLRWGPLGIAPEGTMTVAELEAIADPNISLGRIARDEAEYIDELKEDIQLNGIVNPIIIKAGRNIAPMIEGGHHRLVAAKQLGLTEVPIAYHRASPGWQPPQNNPGNAPLKRRLMR